MVTFRQLRSIPAQVCYFFVFIFFALNLSAGAQNNTPPVYVSYSYMKTAPGKFDSYDSLLKTYSKTIVDNGIKNGDYLQWSIYEVLSPTGSQSDYDVVAVIVSTKMDMLLDPPGSMNEMLTKNFPNLNKAQKDVVRKKYGEARTLVKEEIFQVMSTTGENDGPPTKKPSKYITIDYMSPVPGKEADYANMEIETFKPIHKERMKLGATLGWVMLRKILPGDSNDASPFVTVGFYDEFAGILDGKYAEAVKNVYPNEDANKVFDKMNTVKKGQKVQIWKLMMADSMQGVAAK